MSSRKNIKNNNNNNNNNKNNNNNNNEEEEKSYSLIEKWNEHMLIIENKTGIKGIYVIIFLIVCLLLVYYNIFDTFITNSIGFFYPAFCTMKAIETNSDEDKQWLTYWVCYACFCIFDLFGGLIKSFIPFYVILKVLFLIWLFMPNSLGTSIIYNVLVVRIFKVLENNIDDVQNKFKHITEQFAKDGEDLKRYQNFKKGFKDDEPKRNSNVIKLQDLNKTMIYENNRYDFEDDNKKDNNNNKLKKKYNNKEDENPIKKYNTIKPKID